eukprot:m.284842 g.284842  ORF g.284842 m.284842 type:complete len:355 (-) comp19914_c0_seq5:3677-4741(-)
MVPSAWYTLCAAVALAIPTIHQSFPDTVLDSSIGSFLDSLDFLFTSSAGAGSFLRHSGLTIFNPGRWHGPASWTTSGSTSAGFFEGYYYKVISKSGRTFAVIPGAVYHAENSGGYAFVMVLDVPVESGREHHLVRLFRYNISDLQTASNTDTDATSWSITIGPNTFSPDKISLDLRTNTLVVPHGEESLENDMGTPVIQGEIIFKDSTPWPASIILPDVMGWFAWLPGMECRHGVLSLSSNTHGSLMITSAEHANGVSNHSTVNFDNGKSYIEKDWGSTFPTTWYMGEGPCIKDTLAKCVCRCKVSSCVAPRPYVLLLVSEHKGGGTVILDSVAAFRTSSVADSTFFVVGVDQS